MSTDKGYIRLYRDIREHWIWQDSEYVKAWIDLIMMMNHTDTQVLFDKKLITIKRGSKITSIRKLAERWGWSRGRVKRFLDILEADHMVTTKRDTRKTLITLENSGFYQSNSVKRGTLSRPPTEPLTGPLADHREYIKEYIKGNNKKDCPSDEIGNPWDDEDWE